MESRSLEGLTSTPRTSDLRRAFIRSPEVLLSKLIRSKRKINSHGPAATLTIPYPCRAAAGWDGERTRQLGSGTSLRSDVRLECTKPKGLALGTNRPQRRSQKGVVC